MRITIIILFKLFALQLFGQWSKIDSVIVNKREYIYNKADYKIGHDSIQEIKMVWSDGIEIDTHYTKKLVSRTVYRFITTDSLTPYLLTADFDEVAEDKIGDKFVVSGYLEKSYNDGTGVTTVNPDTTGTVGLATKYDLTTISGGSGLSAEQVRDTTVGMFTVGPSITWNEDDAADSVYLDVNTNPLESAVQGLLIGKSLGFAIASFNSMSTMGMQFTTTGAATGTTISSSSPYRSRPHKYEYVVSTASTTAVAGYRGQGDEVRQADGFVYSVTWGPVLGVSNTSKRAFAGLRNSPSAPTDVSPNTLTTVIGMGMGTMQLTVIFKFITMTDQGTNSN
jgi:hypothetical protein